MIFTSCWSNKTEGMGQGGLAVRSLPFCRRSLPLRAGIEDGSRHQCSVLGEGKRQRRGKLEPPEVVTICNHLVPLGATELEYKIFWEALRVALNLLMQALGVHVVERGEVGINHDLVVADDEDLPGDARGDDERGSTVISFVTRSTRALIRSCRA